MKVGFMCEVDYAIELPQGLSAFLFPTLAAAHKYCRTQVQVEVLPIAALGAASVGQDGRSPYFMCEADLNSNEPFPEAGAFITDSIEGIWRRTSSEQRTVVAVRLRLLQTFSRDVIRADAFVYEDLYDRLGLLHPGVSARH